MVTTILSIFFFFVALWLVGLGVYAYHVFLYCMPGDATKKSLIFLVIISAITVLFVTFFVSGLNWGSL